MSGSRLFLSTILATTTLSLGHLLLFPECAFACSCAGAPLEKQYAWSEAVFAGEAIDVRTDKSATSSTRRVTFRVAEVWKGPEQKTIEVTTATSEASCGYDFEEGEGYLVYAGRGLDVSFCGATSEISLESVDLRNLAVGQPTTPGSLPDTGGDPWLLYSAAAALIGALGTATLIVLAEMRSRSG